MGCAFFVVGGRRKGNKSAVIDLWKIRAKEKEEAAKESEETKKAETEPEKAKWIRSPERAIWATSKFVYHAVGSSLLATPISSLSSSPDTVSAPLSSSCLLLSSPDTSSSSSPPCMCRSCLSSVTIQDRVIRAHRQDVFPSPSGSFFVISSTGDLYSRPLTLSVYETEGNTKVAELPGVFLFGDEVYFADETTICFGLYLGEGQSEEEVQKEKENEIQRQIYGDGPGEESDAALWGANWSKVCFWDFAAATVTKKRLWRCLLLCANEKYVLCRKLLGESIRVFCRTTWEFLGEFDAGIPHEWRGSAHLTTDHYCIVTYDRYIRVFDVLLGGVPTFFFGVPGGRSEGCISSGATTIANTFLLTEGFGSICIHSFWDDEMYDRLFPFCVAFHETLPPYLILLLFDMSEALSKRKIGLAGEERWMHAQKIRFIVIACQVLKSKIRSDLSEKKEGDKKKGTETETKKRRKRRRQ